MIFSVVRLNAANQNNPTRDHKLPSGCSVSQKRETSENSFAGVRSFPDPSIFSVSDEEDPMRDRNSVPESPLIPELPVRPLGETSPLQKERSDPPLVPLDPKV